MNVKESLKSLPSLESILGDTACASAIKIYGRERVRDTLRSVLDTFRKAALAGEANGSDAKKNSTYWIGIATALLEKTLEPNLRKVVNCSGIIVHTNIGRSTLAEEAANAAYLSATSNVNIEYRLAAGERGDRDEALEGLITQLTGAEAATVVNNNAAAILLALNALSDQMETIVSRGELIEIGGSFRLPEIMKKSGCRLKEVGATNRTHMRDYEEAVNENTALILRAHTSNYKIIGFTSQPTLKELSTFAKSKGLPMMVDLGSGAIIDLAPFGIKDEPTIRETLENDADIVTVSCDKLLGGPQAGIIAGRKELIQRIRKNNLKRALRCDKMTLSALEATLRLYLNPEKALREIPTLRHLSRSMDSVRNIAMTVSLSLKEWFGDEATVSVIDDVCLAGAGSAPEIDIPSISIAITHRKLSPNKLAEMFRELNPPIIGRVDDDLFRLDMRCIDKPSEVSDSLT